MRELCEILERACSETHLPGAVALVAGPEGEEVAEVGCRSVGGAPMTRDTIVRIASITKPLVAAATMVLRDRGRLRFEDEIRRWVPELATPSVLRTPSSPLDDVVPLRRPITVRDLLTFQGGYGMPEDFEAPIMAALGDGLGQAAPSPRSWPAPDEWARRLGELPLVHQPGEGWTYNTGADVLGLLLARAEQRPLGDVLEETLLGPLGMHDTGFWNSTTERLATYYRRGERPDELVVVDPAEGEWSAPPPFESGAGGLLSTLDDWAAFGRMLLAGGNTPDAATGTRAGTRVLSEEAVRLMTTAHVDGGPEHVFLDGQGWGFGGSVDLRRVEPWNVLGRYGWAGGTGTAAYVIPSLGRVVVFLSQVELRGPQDFEAAGRVLAYAADASWPRGGKGL
ncbi:serine hydrolase domain-containing protein [Nocardioides insulae]|uniref:serine hydrolase domain-containing protein n=1 Tax=Nocardioides insulae TaxID=394734 RepID=UPI000405D780|nr:serine hydrolase domain-containing protein [Nocardioides insulae]